MLHIVFKELIFFKESFSRKKTWLWFSLIAIAFMGNCDPLGGVSGLVRSLGLGESVYNGLIGFFQSSGINLYSLQKSIFDWIRTRFRNNLVLIGGKELLILDAKKQAKSGKRMPGVKWNHQDSSSASKKEFVTAHNFECMGIAVNCLGSVSCLIFLARMLDGFVKHNRDNQSLKERVGSLIGNNDFIMANRILACDAWYAAQQVIVPALQVSSTIITRVGKTAVGCYEPIKKKSGAQGRPPIYGKKVKLLSLFDTLKTLTGEVRGCSGEIQKVTYWSIELMWQPIKQKVLFVGSKDEKGRRVVLLCTDLSMNPVDVIQAYVYRSSIEHSFWLSTQFFRTWTYRFWTKLDLVNFDLKGNFNLHWCNRQLRGAFQAKVQSYEVFLTIGFLAHAMYLYIGLVFRDKKINENIIFFRSRNREAGASIPILRAIFVNEYQHFTRSGSSIEELGKFILKKYKFCDKKQKVA